MWGYIWDVMRVLQWRTGLLGLSSEHHWGLTHREKSAGNPSVGAAAGKCTLSHLDLSCSVCSADEAEVLCTRNSWGGAAALDELWGRLSHPKVSKGHHVSPVWATLNYHAFTFIWTSHLDLPANGHAVVFFTGLLEVFLSESWCWQQYQTTLSYWN